MGCRGLCSGSEKKLYLIIYLFIYLRLQALNLKLLQREPVSPSFRCIFFFFFFVRFDKIKIKKHQARFPQGAFVFKARTCEVDLLLHRRFPMNAKVTRGMLSLTLII